MYTETVDSPDLIGSVKIGSFEVMLTRTDKDDSVGALRVSLDPDDSKDFILNEARQQIMRDRWWTWEYFETKGLPKQQIELTDGNFEMTLYNYGSAINNEHLESIKEVLGLFAGVRDGGAFQHVRYLVLDDTQPMNDKSGELQNGYGPTNTKHITLNPAAFRDMPSRVTRKTTHLKGTLSHEITHGLTMEKLEGESSGSIQYAINEWIRIGKWSISEKRSLPGGGASVYQTSEPERCVSEYAKSDPDEDFCESMVAAIFDPDILDAEKRDFFRLNFPVNNELISNWQATYISANDINMPEIPQEMKILFTGKSFIKVLDIQLGDEAPL